MGPSSFILLWGAKASAEFHTCLQLGWSMGSQDLSHCPQRDLRCVLDGQVRCHIGYCKSDCGTQERQGLKRQSEVTISICAHAQSCPILCDPMDGSPLSSSVHGVSQTKILESVVISSWPKDQTCIFCVSCIAGGFLPTESHETRWDHLGEECVQRRGTKTEPQDTPKVWGYVWHWNNPLVI